MKPSQFAPEAPGHLVEIVTTTGNRTHAFVPDPLPPKSIEMEEIAFQVQASALALGALKFTGSRLPNSALTFRPFARREAVASSRIEGTHVDFQQLAIAEIEDAEKTRDVDVSEANNYLNALTWASKIIHEYPVSIGLMSEIHRQLLDRTRGAEKMPGQLREHQVFIADGRTQLELAKFVPPPPYEVRPLLDGLCRYIEADDRYVQLIRLAFIHYQFETIHPFNDGNGRLGRLLMPLLLLKWNMLQEPNLYLSEYIERNRDTYVDLLFRVSTEGVWSDWVLFLLRGIEIQANDAVDRMNRILDYREQLRSQFSLSRSPSVLPAIDRLFERPSTTATRMEQELGIGRSAARSLIDTLEARGVLEEITGFSRNRVYLARGIYNRIVGIDDSEL